eukprot:jgi/Hompol1/1225/HPOL_002671-RA
MALRQDDALVPSSSTTAVPQQYQQDKKQFLEELNTMRLLNSHKLGRGLTPRLICACRKRRAIVMDCYADTIAARFEKCNFKFSLKTIIMLLLSMMERSREFYERTGQVHVDLKPSNFCTSRDGRKLILIDFGYSTAPRTRLPGQTGTPLFMSWTIQTLGATFPCWQDDLESLGYVVMFFLCGGKRGLPWGGLRTHRDIAAAKSDQTLHAFCTGLLGTEYEPLAQPLYTYLFVTRDRMRSFEMNDFDMLYRMFENILAHCGYVNDAYYDWCCPAPTVNEIIRLHMPPTSGAPFGTNIILRRIIPPPEMPVEDNGNALLMAQDAEFCAPISNLDQRSAHRLTGAFQPGTPAHAKREETAIA